MIQISMNVEGIKCSRCEDKIKTLLSTDKNIESVLVSHKEHTVEITGADTLSSLGIKRSLEGIGFLVTGIQKSKHEKDR